MGWCTVWWSRSLLKWPWSANFAHSAELWNFQNRLWPGPRDDVTVLTLSGFQLSAWNLVIWFTEPKSRWLLKWPCSANFWSFHETLKFSIIGLGQEDEMEEITLWPEIWWHDVVYHEADCCMKWPRSANFSLSRPAEGAFVLWTSCFS